MIAKLQRWRLFATFLLDRLARTVLACRAAHRDALAARRVHAELSRLSNAELARRGLSRDDIIGLVLEAFRSGKTGTCNDRPAAAGHPADRAPRPRPRPPG